MKGEILFYNEWEPYGELSNYFVRDMVLDGETWASVEHYYQAQKAVDPAWAQKIHDAADPAEAKAFGSDPGFDVRPDWDTWKVLAMRRGLFAKFTQNDDLRALLLDTGDAALHENSMGDLYWGLGKTREGLSMLGKLLMALREELRYFER